MSGTRFVCDFVAPYRGDGLPGERDNSGREAFSA